MKKIIFTLIFLIGLGVFSQTSAFTRILTSNPLTASSRATIQLTGDLNASSRWYVDTLPDKYFNGLVGYYTFNGNDLLSYVVDRSGNGNHGGLVGVSSSTQAVVGMVGQAFKFTGVSDYAYTARTGWPTGNAAWTFSFWIRFDQVQSGQRVIIFYGQNGNTGGANNIYLDINNCGGGNKVGVGNWGGADIICDGTAVTYGRWYYYTITHTSAPRTELYRDGVSVGSQSTTNYNLINSYHNIGRYDGGINTAATFDDYRVYNRALSSAEVLDLYRTVNKHY